MSGSRLPPSALKRIGNSVGRVVLFPIGLAGLAGIAVGLREARIRREVRKDQESTKRRVLVLPFHRMKLVEAKKSSFVDGLHSISAEEKDDRIMEVEVLDLVKTIRAAAKDPNVVALYGIFGHGYEFSSGGWGHVDEVRDALLAFRASPAAIDAGDDAEGSTPRTKPLYAFADTFGNPVDSGNKEYYLASAFSHIHLQNEGEVNLFGLYSMDTFLRSFLEKYGIKVHVFKHGIYKNSPNTFTHKRFNPAHRKNVKNIVDTIDQHIFTRIMMSRGIGELDKSLWRVIRNFGTFTAPQAQDLSLVDHITPLDPLDALLLNNEEGENKKTKDTSIDTDLESFTATEAISLKKYMALMAKREKVSRQNKDVQNLLDDLSEKSTATEAVLSFFGRKKRPIDESDKGKIALLRVSGAITNKSARKTIMSLRKIKKDKNVKCVVLRVDSPGGSSVASEAILQECNDLPQPVVCSMGNYAASGGYYIASGCDKIYALPSTLTGSIGVYGIKFDLTGLAKQYGIRFQCIEAGPHASSGNPFRPMTRSVRANFWRSIDRVYDRFKSVVATGRNMSAKEVEDIAKGRVWTGEQAKEVGLVDELGGLQEALDYAEETFVKKTAIIEKWPKRATMLERWNESMGASETPQNVIAALLFGTDVKDANSAMWLVTRLLELSAGNSGAPSMMLTMDENSALSFLVQDGIGVGDAPLLPGDFWR